MRVRAALVVLLVLPACAAFAGCSHPGQPASPDGAARATPTQTVARVVVHGHSTDELLSELERARSWLLVENFDSAAEALDRLHAKADDPALKALARYNAGVAYEGLANRTVALRRYRAVADHHADQAIARNALVRITRILGQLERWEELEEAADKLLARSDLPVMDTIEGRGAKALAMTERGDVAGATLHVGKAFELIDKHGFGQSGQPPLQIAQVSFASGEIRRIKSEQIKLVPVPPNFIEVLEARCQGLLDAQAAYTDTMRARDAHWSAMSGFRVGQLYTQLHSEAMAIPPPANAKTLKQQQLFEGALRLRYRILLDKGLKMMDATVRLGDRTGEGSEWITRAREAKKALERALEDEKAALAKLAYSEEELRAALETLSSKRSADAGAGTQTSTPAPTTNAQAPK